jgi:hypothetical protein
MAAPGDRDGDGVADNVDNCPDVQNADQADEDGDKIGDACDLCPQIADTGTDADADKVGDACDPNPTLKDTVWVFDGFHTMPTWSHSPNWTAPTPGIIQTVAAGDTNTDGEDMVPQFTPTSTTIDNFSITAVVKVTAEAGTNGDHSTGVEIYDATNDKGVDCALDHDPAGANANVYIQEFSGTKDTSNGQTQTYGWAMNLGYRLTLSRHGTAYKCVASTLDGKTTMTATTTSATVPRNGAALEIWAYGATVQYDSVEVVGAP